MGSESEISVDRGGGLCDGCSPGVEGASGSNYELFWYAPYLDFDSVLTR